MRKISFQSIFCFVSFLFILSCCIFYGTRFIKLYIENEKAKKIEVNSLAKVIRESNENNEQFKKRNDEYYFIEKADNNYLSYSNIIWRIIKLNQDNSLTAISENSLTSLAFGKETDFTNSSINKWLNKKENTYSGILEKQLNNTDKYLQKTNICLDSIDTINNNLCNSYDKENYISLLSTTDFANIGSKESYIINDENFYLENTNSEKQVWKITNEGKIITSIGDEIIGIRPVITIKANIDYISGKGTIDNPYKIEKENSLFGSYVKLGNDLWRVYEVDDELIKLTRNDYLKDYTHNYSTQSSRYNGDLYGSLAYYLNHDYLNSLSYKNILKETKWANGFYNENNNYDYENALKNEVTSKVGLMSMGNIFLNPNLDSYFTMTGTSENSSELYTIQANKKIYTKSIHTKTKILPSICIDKSILKKGNGTIDSPYEME